MLDRMLRHLLNYKLGRLFFVTFSKFLPSKYIVIGGPLDTTLIFSKPYIWVEGSYQCPACKKKWYQYLGSWKLSEQYVAITPNIYVAVCTEKCKEIYELLGE